MAFRAVKLTASPIIRISKVYFFYIPCGPSSACVYCVFTKSTNSNFWLPNCSRSGWLAFLKHCRLLNTWCSIDGQYCLSPERNEPHKLIANNRILFQARIQEKIWPWLTSSDPSPPRKIFEIQSILKQYLMHFERIFLSKKDKISVILRYFNKMRLRIYNYNKISHSNKLQRL